MVHLELLWLFFGHLRLGVDVMVQRQRQVLGEPW